MMSGRWTLAVRAGSPHDWSMSTYRITSEFRTEQPAAVRTATLAVADIGPWIGPTYEAVATFLAAHGSFPAGPPFARYHRVGEEKFEVAAGFPVLTPIVGDGDVHPLTLPGGTAASTVHVGPYDAMEPAYRAIFEWITTHHAGAGGDPWEIYLSDPAAEPDPATWRTEIVQPYHLV
jgi:effector-binding domain-containing protein